MNPSNVRRDIWTKLVKRAGVRALDMYSVPAHVRELSAVPRAKRAFNVAAVMGHSRSHLVDQVYAHSMQSGMASVAERVTARALGEKPVLRVITPTNPPDIRRSLDVLPSEPIQRMRKLLIRWRPRPELYVCG